MEAMVTASRDSTVKVWGADWQIRMVFVGHTGTPAPVSLQAPPLSTQPERALRCQNLGHLWPSFSLPEPELVVSLLSVPGAPE